MALIANILSTIGSVFVKLFPFLFAYKAGRNKERLTRAEAVNEVARITKKKRSDIALLSDDELRKRLHKYTRK